MREILFRGKRVDNGEWVEGYFAMHPIKRDGKRVPFITELKHLFMVEVIPETVGQFTGIEDKCGTKIFEGDTIHISMTSIHENGLTTDIYFDFGAFRYRHSDNSGSVLDWRSTKVLRGYENVTRDVVIVGNIHEANSEA